MMGVTNSIGDTNNQQQEFEEYINDTLNFVYDEDSEILQRLFSDSRNKTSVGCLMVSAFDNLFVCVYCL